MITKPGVNKEIQKLQYGSGGRWIRHSFYHLRRLRGWIRQIKRLTQTTTNENNKKFESFNMAPGGGSDTAFIISDGSWGGSDRTNDWHKRRHMKTTRNWKVSIWFRGFHIYIGVISPTGINSYMHVLCISIYMYTCIHKGKYVYI